MTDYVLWKQLTPTDFNSMHGLASPFGQGGGARHIALGVSSPGFRIDRFLNAVGKANAIIQAKSDGLGSGQLKFASILSRRHGEWMIADQRTHRHPAWSAGAGFPTTYSPQNPPVILVFRIGANYYARWSDTKKLDKVAPDLLGSAIKGVAPATVALISAFNIELPGLLQSFEKYLTDTSIPGFDPANIDDARKKVFATIVRRRGQGPFRDALLSAYSGRCAITKTDTSFVLEAAHIVPYLGPHTNVVQNGLLLRADVHTLFDLGLVSVHPNERKIKVSSLLKKSSYGALHGATLLSPHKASMKPTFEALSYHYNRFQQ